MHAMSTPAMRIVAPLVCLLAATAISAVPATAQRPDRPASSRSRAASQPSPEIARIAGRVLVGTGTLDTSRLDVYVEVAGKGVHVTSRAESPRLMAGDSVEVVGELDVDDEVMEIGRASVRVIPASPRVPEPHPITLHREDLVRWAGSLVTVAASVHLVDVSGESNRIIVVDTGETAAQAVVRTDDDGIARLALDRFSKGDEVQVTGILALRTRDRREAQWVIFPREELDIRPLTMTQKDLSVGLSMIVLFAGIASLAHILRLRRERKHAERQSGESAELVRAILNSTSQIIVFVDPQGTIQALNPAAASALGGNEADAIGLPVLRLFDETSLRRRAAEIAERTDEGVVVDVRVVIAAVPSGGSDEREWTLRRNDGRTFPALASITALYERDGSIRGYSIVASDITARREAEIATERARDAAERSNRVKSEFLANMSHELRTPLNSVIGFANILLKNKHGRMVESDLSYLSRITANGRHLLGLINGILDLSKIEAGKVELEWGDVDVPALVHETLGELESQAVAKGIALRAELPAHAALLRADRARLKQMLINLTANALRFTGRGSITVRIVGSADQKGVARIDVVDTGCGIPADRIHAVFEAFQQADSSTARTHGGTGLGLTITRSLAQLMGFDVTVASTEGVGSTFSIDTQPWLASARDLVQFSSASLEAAAHPPVSPQPRVKALVIDDEADARHLLSQQLRDLGCEVLLAANAAEGVSLARKHHPDLITLDIMMPQTSGIEALRELRADPLIGHVPMVIVSMAAEQFRGQLTGASAVLDKPVEPEALSGVLRRTIPAAGCETLVFHGAPLDALVGKLRRGLPIRRPNGEPVVAARA